MHVTLKKLKISLIRKICCYFRLLFKLYPISRQNSITALPENVRKPLTFSGGIEMEHWLEMGFSNYNPKLSLFQRSLH